MEIHVQSFGARLRMRGEIFVMTVPDLTGAGNDKEQEFAPHQAGTILLYNKSGSISTDAIDLALKNQVDILTCDALGNVTGRFLPAVPSAPVIIQAAQFRLIGTAKSMEFVRQWIGIMFRRKMAFLGRLQRYREGEKVDLIKSARQKLAAYNAQLITTPLYPAAAAANSIRLIEAHASKLYFKTLSSLLPDEYQFENRSRQPAKDIFNAFLNYGYGVLYRMVEKAIILAGLNPFGGFLHSIERNQKAMLFDLTELYRAWIDATIFSICSRKHATQKHLRAYNGGYWLSQTGKALVLELLYEQFERPQLLDEDGQGTMLGFMRLEIRNIAQAIRREGSALFSTENEVTTNRE